MDVRGISPRPDLRLLRGWDFGHVAPAVVFAQLVDGQLRILRELVMPQTALETLIEAVIGVSLDLMGGPTRCFDAGDPQAEAMTDLGHIRTTLAQHGIRLHTVPNTPNAFNDPHRGSYAALRKRLIRNVQAGQQVVPALVLDSTTSPILHASLAGVFHVSPHPPHRPVECHPHKDVADALRYLNVNIAGEESQIHEVASRIARRDRLW